MGANDRRSLRSTDQDESGGHGFWRAQVGLPLQFRVSERRIWRPGRLEAAKRWSTRTTVERTTPNARAG
jgi:hypothetical protein